MLQNAYFLANIAFDRAENEPAKNCKNLRNLPILLPLRGSLEELYLGGTRVGAPGARALAGRLPASLTRLDLEGASTIG